MGEPDAAGTERMAVFRTNRPVGGDTEVYDALLLLPDGVESEKKPLVIHTTVVLTGTGNEPHPVRIGVMTRFQDVTSGKRNALSFDNDNAHFFIFLIFDTIQAAARFCAAK